MMKKLLLTICLTLAALGAQALTTVYYKPTDKEFLNPERGMFTHYEFFSDQSNEFEFETLDAERAAGRSLVFTVYVLNTFRDKEISNSFLKRISRNMKLLRATGMKAIVRFCYSYSEEDHPWDCPWELTKRHIEQLTPIVQENADVIAVLEAGFVGVWGEWYYTENYVFQPEDNQYAPRRQVLDELLKMMPKDRFVSVRYPRAKTGCYGIQYADTITRETAHNGSDFSRIGYHNDCFLATADDTGTFNEVPEARQMWLADSHWVPMGGETCGMSVYCEVPNARKDFAGYHWSYLNKDYRPEVLEKWEREVFMPEIRNKLGYRFVLKEGRFTEEPRAGENMHVELDILNEGWAAPFNPRGVELIFQKKKGKGTHVFPLPDDPRFWLPEETARVIADVPLPADMAPGEYEIYLNLPDPAPKLHDHSEFSIRLANEGLWKGRQGYNKLHTVKIQ